MSPGPTSSRNSFANWPRALDVPYAFVAECTDTTKTRVRTLAFWSRGALVDNVEWSLAGTPCELVIADGSVAYHASDLQTKFPEDRPLVDHGCARATSAFRCSMGPARYWATSRSWATSPWTAPRSMAACSAHVRPGRAWSCSASAPPHRSPRSTRNSRPLRIDRGRCSRSTTPSSSISPATRFFRRSPPHFDR